MSHSELPIGTAETGPEQGRRVDTDTWQMWVIAALPLAALPVNLIPGASEPVLQSNGLPVATAGVILNIALSVALMAIEVLLAVSDRRELVRRGVIRPMHPGWALLDPVYVIGRSVVVRRRVRGSLRPLWAWVLTTVLVDILLNLPS